MKNKVELLAPAGNRSKLNTALYFGADAAYVGGKSFSLRTFADNFTNDELKSAISFAHSLGKKSVRNRQHLCAQPRHERAGRLLCLFIRSGC
jgi:collagenase-like PrtC family protease